MFDAAPRPRPPAPLRELIIWNIGHPSTTRAESQKRWLLEQNAEVLVLTETAQNDGCEMLQDGLARAGYVIAASLPEGREYGTVIASRSGASLSTFVERLEQLPHRAASVHLSAEPLELIGVYVPSRDGKLARSEEQEALKIARKRGFLESFVRALAADSATTRIVCGDFNVLPRNHLPPEPAFQQWEYAFLDSLEKLGFRDAFTLRDPARQDHSWFGHFGDRYRFDYCYISPSLAERVVDASFDHIPRMRTLSDHSPLRVRFSSGSGDSPGVDKE